MKLLTAKEIKEKKRTEEIEVQQRIEMLKDEEQSLIKSINEKKAELNGDKTTNN